MKKTIALLVAVTMLFCSCVKDITPVVRDKYRTYYELFVRSFYDSDNDGIGDLKGVVQKFDYLNDSNANSKKSLNIGGLWLMPVMSSPTYHKYDVTDYYAIDPQYGTMEDFSNLIAKCNANDVSLIMDLVINHTSSEHAWFQSAAVSIGIQPCGQETCTHEKLCREHNPYCKYYNFSRDSQSGFEQVPLYKNWYYECRFWSGMPDLNLDEPLVRAEIVEIMKFWLGKGAAGFRLDAVTSFYTGNSEKNTAFLKWLKAEAVKIDDKCYIVGEAWSPANTVKELYRSGIDSFFNFPFSQAEGLFIPAVRSENGGAVAGRMETWQREVSQISPNSIDAVFLSNHDNGRSAGMLGRDAALIKMAAALYILAPGNAFVYYGEELGMVGSGKDENKRLPMLWSVEDRTGMTAPPPNAELFEQPDKGAAEQLEDPDSVLNYYIKLIRLKNTYPAIAGGILKAIDTGNDSAVFFSCTYGDETVYILHNVSSQPVSIKISKDMADYKKIVGYLSVSGEKVKLKGDTIAMPARSSAVLK